MMDELARSRKEKIAIYALIAFVIVVTMAIGLAVIAKAFGSEGKGLKVDLDVDNQFMNQYSEVDTFQNDRFVGTHDIYINQGRYLYNLEYEQGDIENGPFEVCVFLTSDQIESCGNGYNSEEKKPESVYVI